MLEHIEMEEKLFSLSEYWMLWKISFQGLSKFKIILFILKKILPYWNAVWGICLWHVNKQRAQINKTYKEIHSLRKTIHPYIFCLQITILSSHKFSIIKKKFSLISLQKQYYDKVVPYNKEERNVTPHYSPYPVLQILVLIFYHLYKSHTTFISPCYTGL